MTRLNSQYAYSNPPPLKPKVKPAPKPVLGSGVMMPQFQTKPGMNSLAGALQGTQSVTRPALGAPPMQPPAPQYPTTTPDQAVAMGRQDVSTLEGAMRHGMWNQAAKLEQQQALEQARAYNAQRAEQTGGLRQQMFGSLGNRGASPEARAIGWQGPTAVEPQHVPGQMVPRTIDQVTSDKVLRDAQAERDNARKPIRSQIQAIMAATKGKGTFDASGADNPELAREVFAQEAQRAGPLNAKFMAAREKRKAEMEGRRELINQREIMKGQMRGARIQDRLAGGPQQRMLNNFMAMRNPGLAMESMRMNTALQIANANRELDREELSLKRDALKYGMDESKQKRLDDVEARREELKQRQVEFAGQQGMAQRGLGLQEQGLTNQAEHNRALREQDKQQFDIEMQQLRNQNEQEVSARDLQKKMARSQRRDALIAQAGDNPDIGAIERQLVAEGYPAPTPATQPPGAQTTGATANAVPDEFIGKNGKQIVQILRTRLGSGPEADAEITRILKARNPAASVAYPDGPSLFDVLNPFGADTKPTKRSYTNLYTAPGIATAGDWLGTAMGGGLTYFLGNRGGRQRFGDWLINK